MPKIKVNPYELNKEIDLVDDKLDRLNITKILRVYSKSFELNQYDTSITLLRQFQQIITLQLHFFKINNLTNLFYDFLKNLDDKFLIIFKTFFDFTKKLDDKTIPIF